MTDSIRKPQPLCREEVNCDYRVGGYCTYREIIRAVFSETQDKYHVGAHCIINLADTYDLPCKDLDEKDRELGTMR